MTKYGLGGMLFSEWFLFTMDDEKLIECVRDHEELYNLSHPQYLSANLKVKMWDEISNQLDQPAAACKTRWNNIRDNFRKSLKKRITKSRQSSTKFNKYKYEDQLSFLTPFIKERETLSTLCAAERTTGEETDSNYEENDDDFEENDKVKTGILKSVESANGVRSSSQNVDDNISNENMVSARSNQFIKRKRLEKTEPKLKNPLTTSSNLMKYALDQHTFHPVDAFLIGLAPTLKSLSSYHLNIAKSKIFNIVQEIEMSEIMQETYGTHPEIILSSPSPLSIPSPLPISPTINDSKNAWPSQDSSSSSFHQQPNHMNLSSFDKDSYNQ